MRDYHFMTIGRLTLMLVAILFMIPAVQAETEFFGYFEPQFMVAEFNDSSYQLFSNKLRIDIQSDPAENILIRANINYNYYSDDFYINPLPSFKSSYGDSVDVSEINVIFPFYSKYYFDNAYLRFNSNSLSFTIGRQQISIGSGYAWNPTDMVNRKDIFDPTYEKPGVDGIRLDYYMYKSLKLNLFYKPELGWDPSSKLIRLIGTVHGFDVALTYGNNKQLINYFKIYENRRGIYSTNYVCNMYGFDLNGELFGIGIWSENSFNNLTDTTNYWENLIGVDYTFESGWYLMAEYYRNEQGYSGYDEYTYDIWNNYMNGNTRTMARDQVYFYTFYPVTDLMDIGTSMIYAVSDKSAAIVPTLTYSLADDVTLTAYGNINTGKEGAMYSNAFGYSGIVRIRAYF